MVQQARRNHYAEVVRRTTLLQEKMQAIRPAKKDELLVRAALRDSATAGEILQTAIDYRGNKPRNSANNNIQSVDDHKERVIREAMAYLNGHDRDELLLAAGLRDDATGGDIIQAAIDAQAGGN
ncbi:hypothetical protein F5Y09DRAFT_347236 [Xylaria sp. FL1042]|nr:hypothetical protein F5Y09DRAFT_347236 [Xylaria sp. FL1042]